jgi:hypothetical protein
LEIYASHYPLPPHAVFSISSASFWRWARFQ